MKNHIGKRFGRLEIIGNGYVVGKNSDRMCLCKCDCGNERYVRLSYMRDNKVISCGCYKKELMREKQTIHGMYNTRIRKIWVGIKARCDNPNVKIYKHYGGRGISYDEKRTTFQGFYKDMGESYKDGLEIDRIDNNGNYCKKNCHWVTHKENMQNYRKCHYLEYNGKRLNISQWADEIGKSKDTILRRIKKGLPIEIILSSKKRVY